MATNTAEALLQAIKTQLEAEISGLHVTEQVDVITQDERTLASGGCAILRVGDEVLDDYTTRLQGIVRVQDTIEVQTAWQLDPRDQLTSRDALLARGRAIRVALTGTWGDVNTRRCSYDGSTGPTRHPNSAEWLVLYQRFTFDRFATLGA